MLESDNRLGVELVGLAEEILSGGEACRASGDLLLQVLTRAGITESMSPLGTGGDSFTSPAVIFDAFGPGGGASLRRHLVPFFETVAAPGSRLDAPLQPGDWVLRRALGEGNLAHLCTLATGQALPAGDLAASSLIPEGGRDGLYAQVVEAGAMTAPLQPNVRRGATSL